MPSNSRYICIHPHLRGMFYTLELVELHRHHSMYIQSKLHPYTEDHSDNHLVKCIPDSTLMSKMASSWDMPDHLHPLLYMQHTNDSEHHNVVHHRIQHLQDTEHTVQMNI